MIWFNRPQATLLQVGKPSAFVELLGRGKLFYLAAFVAIALFASADAFAQRRPALETQEGVQPEGGSESPDTERPSFTDIISQGESFTGIYAYTYDVTYLKEILTIAGPGGFRDSLTFGDLSSTPILVQLGYGLTIPIKTLTPQSSICVLPSGQIGFSLFTDQIIGSMFNMSVPAYLAFKYGTDALRSSADTEFGFAAGVGLFGGYNFSPNTYGSIPFITPTAMLEINGIVGNGDLYKVRAQFGFTQSSIDTRTPRLLQETKDGVSTKVYGTAEFTPTFGISLCRSFNY